MSEGPINEEHDIRMEEKWQQSKNNYDVDQDDKISITEEDIKEQKKSGTKEQKMPVTKNDAVDTIESNDAAATIKPTPLPHTSM